MCDIELNKTKSNIQVETSSGKVLSADLVIPCFGSSTNTSAYSNSLSLIFLLFFSIKLN